MPLDVVRFINSRSKSVVLKFEAHGLGGGGQKGVGEGGGDGGGDAGGGCGGAPGA